MASARYGSPWICHGDDTICRGDQASQLAPQPRAMSPTVRRVVRQSITDLQAGLPAETVLLVLLRALVAEDERSPS